MKMSNTTKAEEEEEPEKKIRREITSLDDDEVASSTRLICCINNTAHLAFFVLTAIFSFYLSLFLLAVCEIYGRNVNLHTHINQC